MRRALPLVLALASVAGVAGVASAETGARANVQPIRGAPATANPSPYSGALTCLAHRGAWVGGAAPRIAVGRISDMTGRVDLQTGARASQGAALFAITALGRAGAPVVERLDNTVAEIELNYARQHLLSDAPERAGRDPENFRPIYAGQVAGSRYYLVGGITELNYNIASSGVSAQAGAAKVTGLRGLAQASRYVMNVAVDLRLVDTRSQEVVNSVSFQKQVIGVDRSLGLTGTLGSVGGVGTAGDGAMEPIQAAVRTVVERGVFELLAGIQAPGAQASCLPVEDTPPADQTYAMASGASS
ncbi:holdfast anchoring protein HfaB [Brevundimonas sp. SORGH_AS_0993]|uniref:holdfast anchoring protein HfaB n=1 Tax=Brevundimonas sp. SORGH_AS_0993 TaxID=3041794 RepID=UPI0027823A46|nr:holdfast anchoring protein HfaB [Brevundimonas sp. SORGH_AS_0993]MDQ1153249.1 curli biogenesis system outer membrane secretion channel CsgG [Brevundimonas sp. SORGH_AS_0993]